MSKPNPWFLALACSLVLLTGQPANARPQNAAVSVTESFGSGTHVCPAPLQAVPLTHPTVITTCTQAGLQQALDQGGQVAFDCGPDPVTIPIDSQLNLSTQGDTVLDGGGMVTLDGQGKTRILFKDWHDPAKIPSITVTLQNIRLINGKAPGGASTGEISGGAMQVGHPGTRLHVINSTFENNTTTDINTTDNQGGAIFVHNAYETVIVGSVFRDNSAGNGGAIGAIASGMLLINSLFENNHAADTTSGGIVRGYGGALHLDGVTNSYNPDSNKTFQVCGSWFEGNIAVRGGGATSSVVSDGFGTLASFDRSTFVQNKVSGVPGQTNSGQGGAVYHVEDDQVGGVNEQNFLIRDSTFSQNEVRYQGGAVWVSVLGHGRVENSTFDHNTTTAPLNQVGQGGAMAIPLGNFAIANSLFAENHAAYQAGALHGGGTANQITLSNTIFYSNTLNDQTLPSETQWQGFNTNRPMLDGGQNIQYPQLKPGFNNDVNNNITANPIYSDPLLLPLADNGGPTWTRAMQAGSPAVDAGNLAACPALDQRGYLRLGACDIGPFEFGGLPFVTAHWLFNPIVLR
jgi:Chlamydia polymorphic membrane protein (Chlamydia_PMP) repeat